MTEPTQSTTPTEIRTLPGLLVDSDWLATHLAAPDLRLLDARDADDYAQAHIPGAAHLELPTITTAVDGVPGMLVDPESFAATMQRLGVGDDSTVIVYDSNWGLPASRILWALTYYGHTRVALLNGGWDAWSDQGLPTTAARPTPSPARFTPRPNPQHLAQLSWLQDHLHDPNLVILDTRAAGEVAAGRVPNAVHWDWMSAVPAGSWEAARPTDELRAELAALGVTPDKEIVTYCRSGVRAAHTYMVLRSLGFPRVRNYDGSWLEWSHRVLGIAHP